MKITEVRVKMVQDGAERLRAFCSVTFDGAFVIRDLKVIDGASGPFVAMPSRKLTDRCPRCGCKNHMRARFCNDCGGKLNDNRAPRDDDGRAKLHADIAHPINADCREMVQRAVLDAFEAECEAMKDPAYVANHEEAYEFEDDDSAGVTTSSGDDAGTNSFETFLAELRPASIDSNRTSAARRSASVGAHPDRSETNPPNVRQRDGGRIFETEKKVASAPSAPRGASSASPDSDASSRSQRVAKKPGASPPEQNSGTDSFAAGLL